VTRDSRRYTDAAAAMAKPPSLWGWWGSPIGSEGEDLAVAGDGDLAFVVFSDCVLPLRVRESHGAVVAQDHVFGVGCCADLTDLLCGGVRGRQIVRGENVVIEGVIEAELVARDQRIRDHGITNARTEGYNRLVKQVKRVSCGFRNREHSARRIRFHCTRKQRAATQTSC
jgi:hypothetical protein